MSCHFPVHAKPTWRESRDLSQQPTATHNNFYKKPLTGWTITYKICLLICTVASILTRVTCTLVHFNLTNQAFISRWTTTCVVETSPAITTRLLIRTVSVWRGNISQHTIRSIIFSKTNLFHCDIVTGVVSQTRISRYTGHVSRRWTCQWDLCRGQCFITESLADYSSKIWKSVHQLSTHPNDR